MPTILKIFRVVDWKHTMIDIIQYLAMGFYGIIALAFCAGVIGAVFGFIYLTIHDLRNK
jgi:hypothetical protein